MVWDVENSLFLPLLLLLLLPAYCVGLVLTFIALFFMKTAQPALLYLVPTTLGSVAVLALCRREWWLFFTGKVSEL